MTSRLRGGATVLLLAFMATPVACGGNDLAAPGGVVEVRVRNAAATSMRSVAVGFPYEGGEVVYGDLAPGEASEYRAVRKAYRYAAVRVVVDGDTLGIIPIDYVGETPLSPGRYTYRLGLYEGTSLTLDLEP